MGKPRTGKPRKSAPKPGAGFASIDPATHREIARRGGVNAHVKGTAHEWTSTEAREAGRKGGYATGAAGRKRREELQRTARDGAR